MHEHPLDSSSIAECAKMATKKTLRGELRPVQELLADESVMVDLAEAVMDALRESKIALRDFCTTKGKEDIQILRNSVLQGVASVVSAITEAAEKDIFLLLDDNEEFTDVIEDRAAMDLTPNYHEKHKKTSAAASKLPKSNGLYLAKSPVRSKKKSTQEED